MVHGHLSVHIQVKVSPRCGLGHPHIIPQLSRLAPGSFVYAQRGKQQRAWWTGKVEQSTPTC